jgi:hypothetical protein
MDMPSRLVQWIGSLVVVLSMSLTLAGCARVVVDNKGELKDGGQWEFPLASGTYKVEMHATGDGAALEWRGCDCRGTAAVRQYAAECRLPGGAKLIVRNPSLLNLGRGTNVVLKVTRLPR